MVRRLSRSEWIGKCVSIHGEMYSYDKFPENPVSTDKVVVICPIHGEFEQRLVNHATLGRGCAKCSEKYQKTKQERIDQFNRIHSYKYEYKDLPDSITINTKIKVVCPIHGEFSQSVSNHISGKGCSLCRDDALRSSRITDVCSLIGKFRSVHGSLYDYSKVVQPKSSQDKVAIACHVHGTFEMKPSNHISGQGCPKCKGKSSKLFYIICLGGGVVKYGITSNIKRRLADHKRDNKDFRLNLTHLYEFNDYHDCVKFESLIKSIYPHVLSSSTMPSGYTETTSHENVGEIIELISKRRAKKVAFQDLVSEREKSDD